MQRQEPRNGPGLLVAGDGVQPIIITPSSASIEFPRIGRGGGRKDGELCLYVPAADNREVSRGLPGVAVAPVCAPRENGERVWSSLRPAAKSMYRLREPGRENGGETG